MITICTKCDLCLTRKNIVNGYGSLAAELMFIGEAPGYTEDKSGIPFTGKAGLQLTTYLRLFGFDRQKIYITNCIKCKPPYNRQPLDVELLSCKSYLMEEIKTVNPRIIVLLGNTALYFILGYSGVTKLRGKWIQIGNKWILPMFHPSYLLGKDKDKEKTLTYYDFNKLVDKYRELINFRHNTNF